MTSHKGKHGVSPVLETVTAALNRAHSDTEKFAALLVLTKTVKATDLQETDLADVLDGVGVSFIARLLRTNEAPVGCPPSTFRALGLELLSAFSRHGPLAEKLGPAVASLCELLLADDTEISAQAVTCVAQLAEHEPGRLALIRCEETLFVSVWQHSVPSVELVAALTVLVGDTTIELREERLGLLFRRAATTFREDHGDYKFQLCRLLAAIASRSDLRDDLLSPALPDLRDGLREALSSRLGTAMRNAVFELLAALVERRGVAWALEPDDELWALALALAGVEVRLQLDSTEPDVVLLVRCFVVLEAGLENAEALSQKRLVQLRGNLGEAFAALLSFIEKVTPRIGNFSVVTIFFSQILEQCIRQIVALMGPLYSCASKYFSPC